MLITLNKTERTLSEGLVRELRSPASKAEPEGRFKQLIETAKNSGLSSNRIKKITVSVARRESRRAIRISDYESGHVVENLSSLLRAV